MTTYNPVSPEFLAEVEAVIGKENVFTDPEKLYMVRAVPTVSLLSQPRRAARTEGCIHLIQACSRGM